MKTWTGRRETKIVAAAIGLAVFEEPFSLVDAGSTQIQPPEHPDFLIFLSPPGSHLLPSYHPTWTQRGMVTMDTTESKATAPVTPSVKLNFSIDSLLTASRKKASSTSTSSSSSSSIASSSASSPPSTTATAVVLSIKREGEELVNKKSNNKQSIKCHSNLSVKGNNSSNHNSSNSNNKRQSHIETNGSHNSPSSTGSNGENDFPSSPILDDGDSKHSNSSTIDSISSPPASPHAEASSPHHHHHHHHHHHLSFPRHALTSSAFTDLQRRLSSTLHPSAHTSLASPSNGSTANSPGGVINTSGGVSNQLSPVSAAAAAAAAASFIVNPSFASLAWPSSMAPSHPNHGAAALQSPSSFLGWMRANAAAHPPHGGSLSPSSLSKFSSYNYN